MQATAKDLRFRVKELLATVERGEEVIITFHGKPRAKLVGLDLKEKLTDKPKTLFGIWRDRSDIEEVDIHIRSLRQNRYQC